MKRVINGELVDVPAEEAATLEAEWVATEAQTIINNRRTEILTRLGELDTLSIRALRAKGVGRGNPQDDTSLSTYEDEAELLRTELATL